MTLLLFERLDAARDSEPKECTSMTRAGSRPKPSAPGQSIAVKPRQYGPGDALRQRRGSRDRGSIAGATKVISTADDPQGARARHEHQRTRLSQSIRPARRRTSDDREGGSSDPRPLHPRNVSALLPHFRPRRQLPRPFDPAISTKLLGNVERRRRSFHQDLLYPRAGIQSGDLDASAANRQFAGVVLGGRSGGSRDTIMRGMLRPKSEKAETKRHRARSPSAIPSTPMPTCEADARHEPDTEGSSPGAVQVHGERPGKPPDAGHGTGYAITHRSRSAAIPTSRKASTEPKDRAAAGLPTV